MAKRSTLPKYVSEEVDRKTGKVYVYFRRRGRAKVRMTDPPYSEAFNAHYRQLLQRTPTLEPVDRKCESVGTFGWLVLQYYGSAEFKRLDDRTQRVRRQIVDSILAESVPGSDERRGTYSSVSLAKFTGKAVRALRDRKACDVHGNPTPSAANGRLKALRQVFAYGIDAQVHGSLQSNPARDVRYLPPMRPDGIPAWTDWDVSRFRRTHPPGTMAHLALLLFLELGQRISDIHRLGADMVHDDSITFTQWKNRQRKPVTLTLPIGAELLAALAGVPNERKTFLVNDHGRPFPSANSFGNQFRIWCKKAGLEGRSAHGLRKYFSAHLAELGATDREIMAFTGHRNAKEVDRYTRSVNQRRLARAFHERMAANKSEGDPNMN
ncbi:tyrosine-type recombinase/integrase [Ancylobacter sonchi]|uniref:site-specific integrase n=1 Tax=Ancylobacter sonchi TaxID=1937790 RepID=UPI001BD2011B|nr:tyrosine-type recombinase/integrase [Ancylobacter sonchi]MBS7534239.1 tyrosine-type recombinase/integrase [Ancylobacter sonchi]